MSNPAKRKGTDAENAVVAFLNENGWPHAERRAQGGRYDKGDVTGVDPDVVIEIKNHKRIDLGEWLKELEAEMQNAGAGVGALWIKKRGTTDPAKWYVVMDGESLVLLLQSYCGLLDRGAAETAA